MYVDADGDGYGVDGSGVAGCIPPKRGFADEAGDCDDQVAGTNPGVNESCLTDWDDNCDGVVNARPSDLDSLRLDHCTVFYHDADSDGFGVYDASRCLCNEQGQYTAIEAGDCDIADPAVGRDADGCYVFDERLWTARFDGFQEAQRLASSHMTVEVVVAELSGDAVPDLLLGSYRTQAAEDDYSGALFMVTGPLTGTVRLDDPQVFRLNGAPAPGQMPIGRAVAAADINGDGINELVTGGEDEDGEGVWILDSARWQRDGLDAPTVWLETPAAPYDEFGYNIAVSADVDGNGLPELLFGDPTDDRAGENTGAVYIVENPPAGRHDVNKVYTAVLTGRYNYDAAGGCVAGAGDTDGDGLNEALIGGMGADNSRGVVFLVRGPVVGDISLTDADGIFASYYPLSESGCPVAGRGDADGDGLDDILIGAYRSYNGEGAAYLILGRSYPPGELGMAETAHARFQGQDRDYPDEFRAGTAVEFVQNGGGDDVVVIGSGAADLFVPGGGAITAVVRPDPGVHVIGEVGVTVNSDVPYTRVGFSLTSAPDLDGDGWGELLVGAPSASPGGVDGAGSVFLVSGGALGALK